MIDDLLSSELRHVDLDCWGGNNRLEVICVLSARKRTDGQGARQGVKYIRRCPSSNAQLWNVQRHWQAGFRRQL